MIIVLIAAVVFFAVQGVGHTGKIATTVEVQPKDSVVKMGGAVIGSGTIYLSPGEYSFTAEKTGFTTAKQTIIISKDNHYVGLTPTPVSTEAIAWSNQTENALAVEQIGSKRSDTSGQTASTKNPLIDRLPYSDILGPFTVDYAFDTTDSTKTKIVIMDSTANGRVKALQWIRSQGVDPADLTIEFQDFTNPTNQGDI